eukprot:c17951_g1_i2 orf=277-507(-)
MRSHVAYLQPSERVSVSVVRNGYTLAILSEGALLASCRLPAKRLWGATLGLLRYLPPLWASGSNQWPIFWSLFCEG